MSTSTKKPLLLHQQRECLYYKRSEGLFLQNTNYKCRYQLYKKVLLNKIYNRNFFFSFTWSSLDFSYKKRQCSIFIIILFFKESAIK